MTYTRSHGSDSLTEFKQFDYRYDYLFTRPDGSIVQAYGWNGAPNGYRIIKTRTWGLTPNFKSLSRGKLPTQPFRFSKNELVYPSGSIARIRSLGGGFLEREAWYGNLFDLLGSGDYPAEPFDIDGFLANCDAEAHNKLLTLVKDQKVNLAQVWAERRLTMELISSIVRNIADAYKAFRRFEFVRMAQLMSIKNPSRRLIRNWKKDISGAWLELQYGWKPLVQDVIGAAEQLAQARVVEERVGSTATRTKTHVSVQPLTGNYTGYCTTTTKVTVKYKVKFFVRADAGAMLSKVGLTNLPALGWELLPFSFVVDWFWSIGPLINVMDATQGIEFVSGSRTQVVETTAVTVYDGFSPLSYVDGFVQASSTQRNVEISRTALTDFPSPSLPPIKNPLSKGHLLNALALIWQQR